LRFEQQFPPKRTGPLLWLALAILFHPLAKAEPLVPLTVQLDWIENAQFAGLLVAKEKGWYGMPSRAWTSPFNQ
jgi:ABC-type nitrate/sulfonate/bicarbonate transport system substrate-binding protein